MLLEPISKEELLEHDGIHIEYVEDGFDYFESSFYAGSEASLILFLEKCLELNGDENAYFDFYYRILRDDQKKILHKNFTNEEERMLGMLNTDARELYFPLTKEVLPLPAKLTVREWFFSSFYFTKYPCIIWGNYGRKYPGFFRNKETAAIYDRLAKECRLKVEYLSARGYREKPLER